MRKVPPRSAFDQHEIAVAQFFKAEVDVDHELAYYNLAMMDAFFSRLEHFMVIALAFTDFYETNDDFARFVGSDWGTKFRRVFCIHSDPATKRLYDQLLAVKESFRNPMSHGGFEKGGTSFYFSFPEIGFLPVVLRDVSKSLHFSFGLGRTVTFEASSKLFDEVDNWIQRTAHPQAWLYASSGLPISFDRSSIAHLRTLTFEELDEWINVALTQRDIYHNVDY